MSGSVSMPQLGESVTEGTVTRWLKKEGERVERDEPLLEISTDKVDTEIPSPAAGILRGIAVAEDETVAVGAELALIDEDEVGRGGGTARAAPRPRGAAAGGAGLGGGRPGGPGPGRAGGPGPAPPALPPPGPAPPGVGPRRAAAGQRPAAGSCPGCFGAARSG